MKDYRINGEGVLQMTFSLLSYRQICQMQRKCPLFFEIVNKDVQEEKESKKTSEFCVKECVVLHTTMLMTLNWEDEAAF